MEQLIIIVLLLAGSALFNWFSNRRRQEAEGTDSEPPHPAASGGAGPPPGPARPDQRPRPSQADWEAQLRRLLEGEEPARPVMPLPPPLPPRRVVPVPPVTVARPPQPRPVAVAREEAEAPAHRLVALTESSRAHERAGSLDRVVSAHLHDVHARPVSMTHAVLLRKDPHEARQIVALLARPATARQAIVASFVFGPPKALES
jgi:hypothetical protein